MCDITTTAETSYSNGVFRHMTTEATAICVNMSVKTSAGNVRVGASEVYELDLSGKFDLRIKKSNRQFSFEATFPLDAWNGCRVSWKEMEGDKHYELCMTTESEIFYDTPSLTVSVRIKDPEFGRTLKQLMTMFTE